MKENGSLSLSFLDLLTCCFGSMLLLFFVIVLTRQEFSKRGSSAHIRGGDNVTSFLLITVENEIGDLQTTVGSPIRLMRHGSELLHPDSVSISVSPKYAIFYSTKDLPHGTELRLARSKEDATVKVSVYDGDRSAGFMKIRMHDETCLFSW